MIGTVPISWSALWFSLLFSRPFNFSSASLFSFQIHTEMKHLKSKDHIWRLLSCRTVLTMGTMYILADSKRTSAPWWRFHITWKIIHCPAASVSCFLLSAMDAKTTTAERYTHGLAWSVPSSSIGNCTAYMQDLWLKILSSCCFLVCFAKKKKKKILHQFSSAFFQINRPLHWATGQIQSIKCFLCCILALMRYNLCSHLECLRTCCRKCSVTLSRVMAEYWKITAL